MKKKRNSRLVAFVLSLALALGLFVEPITASANSDVDLQVEENEVGDLYLPANMDSATVERLSRIFAADKNAFLE